METWAEWGGGARRRADDRRKALDAAVLQGLSVASKCDEELLAVWLPLPAVEAVGEHDNMESRAVDDVRFEVMQARYAGEVGMLEKEPPFCSNVSDPGYYGAKVFVAMRLLAHGVRVVDNEDGGVVLYAKPDVM
jgi:hypothetical protein